MNQRVAQFLLHPLPAKSDPVAWDRWFRGNYRAIQTWATQITQQVNGHTQYANSPILTAAPTLVLAGASNIFHVAGTAPISNFDAGPGHTGPIWLIADDLWRTVLGGNIHEAIHVVVGRTYSWVYDGTKWYLH